MSKPKKLNLSFQELAQIAKALNANILANKSRKKELKISTDKFIRDQFNISRKDFKCTCEDFGIKFDPTTCLYEIPSNTNAIQNTNVIEDTCITFVLSDAKKRSRTT